MSDIPPNIVGSSAQAGYHQAEVARARDAQRTDQYTAAKRGIKAIDDAGNTIESSDDDVAVFADAEGAGGQGRFQEEESDEAVSESEDHVTRNGLITDSDGQEHLDIQA